MKLHTIRVLLIILLATMAGLAQAETISGRLDRVSFEEGIIEINGTVYQVQAEATRVRLRGAMLSEEDLRNGDQVEIILSDTVDQEGKRELRSVNILRGSKTGLES